MTDCASLTGAPIGNTFAASGRSLLKGDAVDIKITRDTVQIAASRVLLSETLASVIEIFTVSSGVVDLGSRDGQFFIIRVCSVSLTTIFQ